jgi:acyl-lipid omega-6 desaturase (Delta-12 desaturase)
MLPDVLTDSNDPAPNLSTNAPGGQPLSDVIKLTRPFAEENRAVTWFHVITTAAVIVGALFLSLPIFPLAVRIFGSLLASISMIRGFIIYHDYSHGAVLRNSPLGSALMYFVGLYYLRPPEDWKRSHNFHHQNNAKFATANVGSFPIYTCDEWTALPAKKKRNYRIVRHPLVLVFGYLTIFVMESFNKLLSPEFKGQGLRFQAFLSIVLHFSLIYAALHFGGWDVLVLSILIPYVISCMSGGYLFYMQHNFEGAKFKPDCDWDFTYAALNSSSCLKCGPLTHWFTGNIGYHHIHHLNHRIPFYRLPETMKAVKELQNPIYVDLHPKTIWRTLNLKLWDARGSRMVTFKQYEEMLAQGEG